MKIGIYGYGNLGRGVENAIAQNPDTELFGVFTRRAPETVKTVSGAKVYPAEDVFKYKNEIDVLVICGGSAADLPKMTPMLAEHFNVVDSFDTHANIPLHFDNVEKAALKGNKTALISAGWDPGLFSLNRIYANAVLPEGADYTFWGRGVSQGHSDAIRRIDGVIDARQYTVPVEDAVNLARSGNAPELSARQKHLRECYVVADAGADKAKIERQIKEMPNYFADYDTTVTFITAEEMQKNHKELPHGGFVIRTGVTGKDKEHKQVIEYSLKLDSNPEFTAGAIIAFARAVFKMHSRGENGCKTVFDIAPIDLIFGDKKEIIKNML